MNNKKFKLVISSGKGGVGKSMLASSLAMLFAKEKKIVAVDCDVDAPNLAIWLNELGNWEKIKEISVSEKPVIDNRKLTKKEAEECVKKCKCGALKIEKGKLKLNPFLCEGCGACQFFCKGVTKMKPVKSGEIKIKKTKYGFHLIVGQLYPGETNSGKIVDEIKAEAEKFDFDLMIIDSAPGTGCPVISALKDANFAILVCEPTPLGFSDLKRVLEVVNHFKIPYGVVINKWNINEGLANKIEKWAKNNFLGKISYDKEIFSAISSLKPIMETNLKAKKEIEEIFENLNKINIVKI